MNVISTILVALLVLTNVSWAGSASDAASDVAKVGAVHAVAIDVVKDAEEAPSLPEVKEAVATHSTSDQCLGRIQRVQEKPATAEPLGGVPRYIILGILRL
jgi:hypothetical protein